MTVAAGIPGVRGKRGMRTSASDRMWRRVVPTSNGCLEFTGSTDSRGYGQVMDAALRRPVKAHRLAWESTRGPIPDGIFVCHHCDNPPCVNPDHLFLGNDQTNVTDMVTKGRHHSQRKTHCPSGHPYDDTNTLLVVTYGRPRRVCRICRLATKERFADKTRRPRRATCAHCGIQLVAPRRGQQFCSRPCACAARRQSR